MSHALKGVHTFRQEIQGVLIVVVLPCYAIIYREKYIIL